MNAEQREAFDRDGYIVVRDALSQQQVYALNAGFDERIQDVSGAGTDKDKVRFYIGDRPSSEIADRHGNKYSGRRFWSQAYRDLVDNPVVLPILREILGDRSYCHAAPNMPENLGPQFRLDHDNVHYKPPAQLKNPDYEDHGGGLHGGFMSHHVTCVYELCTVEPGTGGFGCCPGTHKPGGNAKLENMPGVDGRDWVTQWVDSPWTAKHPNWDSSVPVHRVEGRAGDCILFTEKLKHGTIPWTGLNERRTLFFKYVPFGMHHGDAGYDVTDPALSPSQRSILEFSPCWFNLPREGKRLIEGNPSYSRLHPNARVPPSGDFKRREGWAGPRTVLEVERAARL